MKKNKASLIVSFKLSSSFDVAKHSSTVLLRLLLIWEKQITKITKIRRLKIQQSRKKCKKYDFGRVSCKMLEFILRGSLICGKVHWARLSFVFAQCRWKERVFSFIRDTNKLKKREREKLYDESLFLSNQYSVARITGECSERYLDLKGF